MKAMHSRAAVAAVVLALGTGAAHAGAMDFLFGKKSGAAEPASAQPDSKQRSWSINEFTAIRLVPREAGSAPNEQPISLQPEGLRQQLALIRARIDGKLEQLFHADELKDIIDPLVQALSAAGPNDDILLLSTSRRGEGFLSSPLGVTARLFVQGSHLNVVVHDVRKDFVNAYRGTHMEPHFEFGSRDKPSAAAIQTAGGVSKRGDWVQLPITGITTAAAPVAPVAPEPLRTVSPVAPAAVVSPAPPSVAAPAAAPVPASRDTAFYEEQARRLKGLKLMRDQGAISEEEYQQKRKEILSGL